MLFDFQTFVRDLGQNEEKKEVVTKYEKFFGSIEGDVKNQLWYKDYVSKFSSFSYAVLDELNKDFDWDLLCILVASSFSSDGFYLNISDKGEL